MSATTFAALIKEAIANMPDTLNSKKEIDEYYKKAIKDVKEKVNEENKGGKAPRKALGVKPAKEAKAAPKKRVKKADVDSDGNEIEKVKKPTNAYQQFIKDNRQKVKDENPNANCISNALFKNLFSWKAFTTKNKHQIMFDST